MKKSILIFSLLAVSVLVAGFFFGCGQTREDVTTTSTTTSSTTSTTGGGGTHGLTNLFFLHHSVGDGIVVEGNMRATISSYNSSHGTSFAFWDHGYNLPQEGLRDPSGNLTNTDYAVPGPDNTDPEGLYWLWTSSASDWTSTRNKIMTNHQVIAFKSCYPSSDIQDATDLAQYKTWYLAMRDYFDQHPEKLFVVMSTPPMHPGATDAATAKNARLFANWLKSSTYLSGHPNVVCFDLFDYLAKADDGSADANMLKQAYQINDPSDPYDSHLNTLANQTVGPIFAQFLINAALSY